MALVSIEMKEEMWFNKEIDYRVLAAIITYSWYDGSKKRRKIKEDKIGYMFISSVTYRLSRYKYNKTIKYLKEIEYLTIDKDDERYYNIRGSAEYPFFIMDNAEFRKILKELDEDCLKLFMWMSSMNSHAEYGGHKFIFSYSTILSKAYGIAYNTKNVNKAKKSLEHLISLKLVKIVNPWFFHKKKCMLLTSVSNTIPTDVIQAKNLTSEEKRKISPTKEEENAETNVPQYFNGREYYYDVMYEENKDCIYNICDENADWFSYWGLSIHI